MGTNPSTPITGDDSAGFDDLERTFVRRFVPEFDWLTFSKPSPRHPLPVPLQNVRVGLVTTAGAHLPEQDPMSPTGDVRLIPVEDAGRLQLNHIGYDTARASRDPNVVVPTGSLQRLVAEGFIGSLAPTLVSGRPSWSGCLRTVPPRRPGGLAGRRRRPRAAGARLTGVPAVGRAAPAGTG
jgi:hypothetical protein